MKNTFGKGKSKSDSLQRLIDLINRKEWWHVPPRDPGAYRKRGQFLASSYREAEFWGRPLIDPVKVSVEKPLVGDETTIERELFGRPVPHEDLSMEERWTLDARMKQAALRLGYDSILLMAPQGFAKFSSGGKTPWSMELNILAGPGREFPQ